MRSAFADPSMKFYVNALSRRDLITGQLEKFLSQYDVLLFPVMLTPAFTHRGIDDIEVNGKKVNYHACGIVYASFFSIGGQPVVTIPIGFTKENLPLGIQIIGKRFSDLNTLNVAQLISETLNINIIPPGY